MMLAAAPGMSLICVDHFARRDRRKRVMRIAGRFSDRCVVYPLTTAQAAPLVLDESLDFLYLDAGHKYGCVRADIRAWWPKVRANGWFGGHDYHPSYPGVVLAVRERFGPSVTGDKFNIWSVSKT
jgi:hypothetical protein